ncbi:exonuclease [Vibrio phage qdvp001]|uniref:exonuclease n=1 Tax=Vibrio phage qdvp001 TaxID=1003177 RepID=UPI0007229312|nr:exonuclease [Vibrio phage qdvp001]ALM62074.1 putative exodeoxyribonuclease [Vibrio phage qdvp001]
MKFENKGFTSSGNSMEGSEQTKKEFIRDESDNPIFKKYQVDNISDLISDDCVAYYDSDTLYFQSASNQENKMIEVKHKTEGWVERFSGVKVFRGLGKGIKEGSWLYGKNLEREVEGKTLYTLEDFEIEEVQELKDTYEKSLEQAKIQVLMKLKRVRQQFRIPKIVTVIGEGSNFRNSLPLCRPYKGNRVTKRPLLLKDLRKWAVEELGAIEVPLSKTHGVIEVDDYVDMMGYSGYLSYIKTGKFDKIAILSDKDGFNAPKLLCNPDTYSGEGNPKRGKFKYPQPMIVPNSLEDKGDIEIIAREKSTDYKFIGFLGLLWQITTFDGSDNYSALGHLNGGMGFGADGAYKLLKSAKNSKDALQRVIDKFAELLPYGVQYTDCHGVYHDIPTLEYMNTYFRVVYMLRNMEDDMDFYKLCKAMKVDTSKIENNNLLSPPVKTYCGNEGHIKELSTLIQSIISEDMKGCKQLKSLEKNEVFDKIKSKLESIDFECHYKYVQHEKNLEK